MSFASQISRCPRPFEADRGDEIRQLFDGEPPEVRELLAGAGGCSPYLKTLMEKDCDWLRGALSAGIEPALRGVTEHAEALDLAGLKPGLRKAKRRVALLVALADLGGLWSLEQVTATLTDFADLAVDLAIRRLLAVEIERGKIPGAGPDDLASAAGMSVLAMGKMGAGELNYSSDIDLICLFDEHRYAPDDYGEVRAAFVRVTRKAMAILSDLTGDGYVFRTDLRLRPDPSGTPVCLSMEAAERYYESVGRTWERAAHIKARVCAGDLAAGNAYLKRLTPFIWRRHLDFAAIDDAHDMRLRIRSHKGLHGGIALEGHNMKLGAGGIREIEFFTQTRQIIAGGRDADLRVRGTVEGLAALADKGWVPGDVSVSLTDDYRAHREIEHRLQMINDAQTHDLPRDGEGFARLAAFCGRGEAEMRGDLADRLARVHEQTEGFFAPPAVAPKIGADIEGSEEVIARWRSYPALRSDRAVAIFTRLTPEILNRLQKAARPVEALAQFDRFLSGLPAGVQVFSLFEANPQLIDLIVDIAATAPALALYLGRNSQVFDAVIGGDFFAPWPDAAALERDLSEQLEAVGDYEGRLDSARRWMKEWHFRIGVHYLRGLIDADGAGGQYADLADAVIRALWPVVTEEFSRRHGAPPGRGAAVIAMGSLGARRLSATSDLDLIVIYDADGAEASEGRRPLSSGAYFARLTQALVTALSAPMSEGRLYEVDMRLRPSGRQGPVATSLSAFRTYQREQAWTWEHLALTRARPVAGDAALCEDIEVFRGALLGQKSDPIKTLADVADMRERISAAKSASGVWEAKLGPGRMQDIELLAQAGALMAGDPSCHITEQLAAAERIGWIDSGENTVLAEAYGLLGRLRSGARLLTGKALDLEDIGQGGLDFLLRETGASDAKDLAARLKAVSEKAAKVVDRALGNGPRLS